MLRVLKRKNFEGGPFRLGILQLPINLIAIAWVIISTVPLTLNSAGLPHASCVACFRCFPTFCLHGTL